MEIDGNIYNDYYTNDVPQVKVITNFLDNYVINKTDKSIELIYNEKTIDDIRLHKKNRLILNIKKYVNKVTLLLGRIYQKIVKELRKVGGK